MVARTWLGGGNNRADNPKDWSPKGLPQPGDTIIMAQGTMKIANSDLPLNVDNLEIHGNSQIDLTNDAAMPAVVVFAGQATINVHGTDDFRLETLAGSGDSAVVNLAANSHWIGAFSVFGGSLLINGASHASFISPSESGVIGVGVKVTINAAIGVGAGTIDALYGATLEIGSSVAAGQVLRVIGDGATLQIDHPAQFAGSVVLSGGQIDLEGLAKATGYSFQNDLLSIYNGKTIIDTLNLTDSTANGFAVEKTATGVVVAAYLDATHGLPVSGTLLPLHH